MYPICFIMSEENIVTNKKKTQKSHFCFREWKGFPERREEKKIRPRPS